MSADLEGMPGNGGGSGGDSNGTSGTASASCCGKVKVEGCALCEMNDCCPDHCCDWDTCECGDCEFCGPNETLEDDPFAESGGVENVSSASNVSPVARASAAPCLGVSQGGGSGNVMDNGGGGGGGGAGAGSGGAEPFAHRIASAGDPLPPRPCTPGVLVGTGSDRQIKGDTAFVINGEVAAATAAGPGIRGVRYLKELRGVS